MLIIIKYVTIIKNINYDKIYIINFCKIDLIICEVSSIFKSTVLSKHVLPLCLFLLSLF